MTDIVGDLEIRVDELRAAVRQQLKELVSRDEVDRLARKDETLRASRQIFLDNLLMAIRITQSNEHKEELSRDEWGKSLWYWQMQRDDQRSDFDKSVKGMLEQMS
jgi:hypothetical protein